MTLHVAGPFTSEAAARAYLKQLARDRNMNGTGGLHVAQGYGANWHVREYV